MKVESQGLEFKEKVENFREISKTACAFANAFGGKISIGIGNKGSVMGVSENEIDSLQQRIEGAIQQLSPVPLHKIYVEGMERKKIVQAEIYRIGDGAFCTLGGMVYYRTGSTNSKLEGRTLQDYMVSRRILSFDESRSKACIEDIDTSKLKDFMKIRSPKTNFGGGKTAEYLINLGLAQKNGELWIRNATLLFFAQEPARFIPQNEIRMAKFRGTRPVDIMDSKFSNSTILENLREAEDFIRKNTRTALKIEKLEREEVPEYPLPAIREALVNALTHRDYFSRDAVQINVFDDRIEFINPGTLPQGLTLKILGSLSIQRNPLTYMIMRDFRMVEGMATGIPRMRSLMKEAGLPEPHFEELGSFFKVTLYNKHGAGIEGLNERQKLAVSYLDKNPSLKSKTYEKMAGVSNPVAVADLNDLAAKGLVKKIGKTRGAYYVKA